MLEERVAWDYPQTRGAWSSYRSGAGRIFGAGLVCVAVVIAGSYLILARADGLRDQGVAEPAPIPGAGTALVLLTFLGMGLVPIGAGALLRARRWGAALQREPWTAARLRVQGANLLFQPSLDEPVPARLLSTNRWRVKTVLALDGLEVWLAPVGPREVVFIADGTETVYGARRMG
ncbi:hypothetical protein BH20ACT5_BH20ACT5_06620 [soil metagenome]